MNKTLDELVRIELDKKEGKRNEIECFGKERINILNDNLFNGLEKLKITTHFETVKIYNDGKQIFEMDNTTIGMLRSSAINALDRVVIRILDRANITYDKSGNYYRTVIKENQWLAE